MLALILFSASAAAAVGMQDVNSFEVATPVGTQSGVNVVGTHNGVAVAEGQLATQTACSYYEDSDITPIDGTTSNNGNLAVAVPG